MRFGVVTKIWGRERLTKLVLGYYAGLQVPGVELVRCAAVSPDDPEGPHHNDAWHFVEASNDSLSDKGNAAAVTLREYGVDAILNVGSDDLVNAAYIVRTCELIDKGVDYISPSGIYFYDTATGHALYRESPRIGAGRVLSSSLLNLVDWKPWRPGGNGPDKDMDARAGMWCEAHYVPGEVVMDVKTDVNIGTYASIKAKEHREVESAWLMGCFSGAGDELLGWANVP